VRKIDLDAERNFENRKALGENIRGAQSRYYWAVYPEIEIHKQKTFNLIKGKDILEIGCASGYDAIHYCSYSSSYLGLDISNEAIKNCNQLGLTNAVFRCVDGHKIPLKDSSVDCVIVNSLLHHLDLNKSFPEIYRVLKADGVLIFREPLGINPFFQLYRLLTPSARTRDEHPFSYKDLILMRKYFSLVDIQYFGFSSLISSFGKFLYVRSFFLKIDKILSKTTIKYFFWQFSGFAKKLK
jgi:SAM-dependent methyltransferase